MPPRERRRIEPHDFRASGLQFFGLGQGLGAHSGMFACARTHNHAHSDFGSIDLYGLGRPLLTDSSVTSYAEDSYRSERAHNTVVPVRRVPLGPRLDRLDHVRTHLRRALPEDPGGLHGARPVRDAPHPADRVPGRRGRGAQDARARAGGALQPDDVPAFWLVVDRVERSHPYPGGTRAAGVPGDLLPLQRPADAAGLRSQGIDRVEPIRSGWRDAASLCPDGRGVQGQAAAGAGWRTTCGPARMSPATPTCRSQPSCRSVTTTSRTCGCSRASRASTTAASSGPCWRTAGGARCHSTRRTCSCRFRGMRSEAYATVEGQWGRAGDLSVTVRLPQGAVRVSVKGLGGKKPQPRFLVRPA